MCGFSGSPRLLLHSNQVSNRGRGESPAAESKQLPGYVIEVYVVENKKKIEAKRNPGWRKLTLLPVPES